MAKKGMNRPNDDSNKKPKNSVPPVSEIHNKVNTTQNKKSNTNNQYR